jgi:hypothetical protein
MHPLYEYIYYVHGGVQCHSTYHIPSMYVQNTCFNTTVLHRKYVVYACAHDTNAILCQEERTLCVVSLREPFLDMLLT